MSNFTTQTGFADVNGAQLYYEISGDGPALTLIHEGIADHRMWDDQVPAFAARYRVIRYDLRGYGKSSLPPGPFSMSDDLYKLLQTLGVERTYLLGGSMGGGIAIDFTLTHPEMVAALIPMAAGISGRPPSPELIAAGERVDQALERDGVDAANELEMQIWVDGPKRTPDQVDPTVRKRIAEMNRRALERGSEFERAQYQGLEPPAIGRLSEVHTPTLVIVGDGDQPSVIESCALIAQQVPGAREVIMPGLAHAPNMERPEEFNQLVLDFLAGLPA
ncbi:MAG TPA: alpha/beta fold hydrolase [Ktedonobacterales bacterium]|nr:alpha/beta fold hydrolase [Ktedonobacterales bacterium]